MPPRVPGPTSRNGLNARVDSGTMSVQQALRAERRRRERQVAAASQPQTGGPMYGPSGPTSGSGGGTSTPSGGGGTTSDSGGSGGTNSTGVSYSPPKMSENPFVMGGYNPFDMMQQIYKQGMGGGSTTAMNTAANRLRERVDAATRGNVQSAQAANLSRGFGVSGINDAAVRNQQAAGMNAYAQGLSDLEQGFEDRRLQGLNIAANSAKGMADSMGGYFDILGRLQAESMGNASDWKITGANNSSREKIAELQAQAGMVSDSMDLIDSDNMMPGGSGDVSGGGASSGGGWDTSRPPSFSPRSGFAAPVSGNMPRLQDLFTAGGGVSGLRSGGLKGGRKLSFDPTKARMIF